MQSLPRVVGVRLGNVAGWATAVADRYVEKPGDREVRSGGDGLRTSGFAEIPDILATVAQMEAGRPDLVIGFAAETDDVIANATAKRKRKGCDWIVANDVSPSTGIMGGSENDVTLIMEDGSEDWPRMSKDAVAARLAAKLAEVLS